MRSGIVLLTMLALLTAGCGKSREEELREQQSKGAELVEDKAAMAKGIGEALKTEGKEAAKVLTEGVGGLAKGVAEGVDRVESSYQVLVHEEASKKSLSASRAVAFATGDQERKGVKVYVMSKDAFKGSLQLRAFDAQGSEIGRSAKVDGVLTADDATYIPFLFDAATPMSRVVRIVVHVA